MSIQDVRNSWIYLDRNTQLWRGHISATQGVYQPIHWVAQGRMQAELRLTPYEGRIADVGCGHGILTVNLAWKLPRTEVIGVDPDEDGLAIGRELLREHQIRNCSFRVGTIEQPGIEPASCTGVLCTETLDHIPDVKPKLKEKVDQLLALVRPGGRLIISILDLEGGADSGMAPPSPLSLADFGFLPQLLVDRNCPRWWLLFYVDKK
jgi:2-polyprenyl-3-methyl-5-hydroxy-6-metoxy-1,4-benzoquinol methylase